MVEKGEEENKKRGSQLTDSTRKEGELSKIMVQWNTFVKIKKKNYLEDYIFVK